MPKQVGFPRDLLSKPIGERIAYFKKVSVSHAFLSNAYEDLMWRLKNPGETLIFFLMGPSGSGKTRLFNKTLKEILTQWFDMKANPGIIPAANLLLDSPNYGIFKWPNYYRDCLKVLSEPMIKDKIKRKPPTPEKQPNTQYEFEEALDSAFEHREVKYFFVDEAQHFEKVASGRKLSDQMASIQTLVQRTRVIHILVGTYDLIHLSNLSGQLARRSNIIHLPRYRSFIDEEMKEFERVLSVFLKEIPLEKEIDFADDIEYFYVRSVGCIGILKPWLEAAVTWALEAGARTIEREHLDKFALTPKQLEKLASEASFGEQHLYSTPEAYKELWQKFNTAPKDITDTTVTDDDTMKKNESANKTSHKVGLRKPTRDAVGM